MSNIHFNVTPTTANYFAMTFASFLTFTSSCRFFPNKSVNTITLELIALFWYRFFQMYFPIHSTIPCNIAARDTQRCNAIQYVPLLLADQMPIYV